MHFRAFYWETIKNFENKACMKISRVSVNLTHLLRSADFQICCIAGFQARRPSLLRPLPIFKMADSQSLASWSAAVLCRFWLNVMLSVTIRQTSLSQKSDAGFPYRSYPSYSVPFWCRSCLLQAPQARHLLPVPDTLCLQRQQKPNTITPGPNWSAVVAERHWKVARHKVSGEWK